MLELKGVIPPLATPVDENEKIDEAGLRRLIDYVIAGGVHSIFVLGSMGEFDTLPYPERRRTIEVAIDAAGGRVPVVAGIGDTGTAKVIQNGLEAREAGADGAVVITPFGVRLASQEAIIDFYKEVADAVEFPLIIYDNPRRTQNEIELDTLLCLAEDERIIAVKDSTGDFRRFMRLIHAASGREDFKIFQGDEQVLDASMLIGADGFVPGIGSLTPGICVDLYKAGLNGDKQKAFSLQMKLHRIFAIYGPGYRKAIQGMKCALSLLGICGKTCLRPRLGLSPDEEKAVKQVLEEEGIIR